MIKLAVKLSATFLFLFGAVCLAGPLDFFRGSSVEADPNKDYRLETSYGPWLIMAASFSGPDAPQDAKALTLELRQRYKLHAYTHHMTFAHQLDPGVAGRHKFLKPPTSEEWAVLVGHFSDLNDAQIEKTIKAIKAAKPECLNTETGKGKSLNLAYWRQVVAPKLSGEEQPAGPMSQAMAIPNPLLPKEFFTHGATIDDFIAKLNARTTNSLLDNPGKYSVRIATFSGKTIVDQKQIREFLANKDAGKETGSTGKNSSLTDLEKAGLAAGKLCEALRKKGYEAYVFHDRYESIVTIGSFDMVEIPMADGSMVERQEIAALREQFTGKFVATRPGQPMTYQAVTIAGIALDYQPKIIPVPRTAQTAARR